MKIKKFPFSSAVAGLTLLLAMALNSCKDETEMDNPFPVNETFAAELISKGVPADIAQFFAAVKMESSNPDDRTCIYLQTFPNGASREMTLRVDPNPQYTPTPDEISNIAPGSIPIYGFKYSSSVLVDGTTKIELNYFVAKEGITKGDALLETAGGTGETNVVGISWIESWKKGADVGIGSIIKYFEDQGVRVGPLGSLFALASAASDVTGAVDLSIQNKAWLNELDALENCATNPTNPITLTDPDYSAAAVAKIQSGRSELKEVAAVRFLNIMTETSYGITPITAGLSIGLKQAFLWVDQTLNDFSEGTIMREARLFVEPCMDPKPLPPVLEGNIDVLYEAMNPGIGHLLEHTQTNVRWVLDAEQDSWGMYSYTSEGSYTLDAKATYTYAGKPCTKTWTAAGSIEPTGKLMIYIEPQLQVLQGASYEAGGMFTTEVAVKSNCEEGDSGMENYVIFWLPDIKGFPNREGRYEGEKLWISDGTHSWKIKWTFSVPPAK